MTATRIQYVRPADPRLGRHVNHDPESRRYPARARRAFELRSTLHVRHVPVFDQGSIGSCTGNAGIGCMATGPFFATVSETEAGRWPLNEDGAVKLYSAASRIDPFSGEYPPEDTGSDGLSIAKVLKADGLISGYTHAFSLADMVAGLMTAPCIVGTEWTEGMFSPDTDGLVRPVGSAAGGHEFVCDQVIAAGDAYGPRFAPASRTVLGFTNSWGTSWGIDGRFYMTAEDFAILLDRSGDATFFVPSNEPAPDPLPVVPTENEQADLALAAAVSDWARKTRPGHCIKARKAVRTWLDVRGF